MTSKWLVVPWPVLLIAGLMLVGLLAVSGAYGFHGDEMYYVVAGQHPAFGYVDQPPLTPLLSAASVALLGVSPTAVRVLPALEMALVVVLVALIARDLGGSRRAQVLAAVTAALSGYLGAGHLDTTTEPDLLAWAVILWLLVKLLAGGDRRLWLAVGVVAGIGLENKDTLLFLGAGLAVGLVVARRWDVVRSPWAWAAIGIALLLWAPNLAWQAANGWPQLTMASGDRRVRRRQPGPDRAAALAVHRAAALPGERRRAGLGAAREGRGAVAGARDRRTGRDRPGRRHRRQGLLRDRQRRPCSWPPARSSSTAGSRAATSGSRRWASSRPRRCRARSSLYLTLPILPVATYAKSSLPAAVPDTADAGRLAAVRRDGRGRRRRAAGGRACPRGDPDQRLQRGQPARPARHAACRRSTRATTPTGTGDRRRPTARSSCTSATGGRPTGASSSSAAATSPRSTTGSGSTNSEQGKPIAVCTGLRAPWTTLWPSLRTIS